jgi:hypothetical protein
LSLKTLPAAYRTFCTEATAFQLRLLRSARAYWLSLLVCGLSLLAFSRTRTLPLAIGAAVPLCLSLAMFTSMFTPLLLKPTPQAMIGRVSAVISTAQVLGGIAGTAGAGLAAGSLVMPRVHAGIAGVRLGPYDTIYLLPPTCCSARYCTSPRSGYCAPPGHHGPGRARPAAEPAEIRVYQRERLRAMTRTEDDPWKITPITRPAARRLTGGRGSPTRTEGRWPWESLSAEASRPRWPR